MLSYKNYFLYNTPSPVSLWGLDEASGNALDSKGINHGIPKNEAGLTRAQASLLPNKEGKSCKFTAASLGYFELPDTETLDVGDLFSIGAWVKAEGAGTFRTIFGGPTNSPLAYLLTTNKLRLDKRGVAAAAESAGELTAGTVYHIFITKNGATRKVYVNGAEVSSNPANQTIEKPAGIYTIGKDGPGTSYMSGFLQYLSLSNAVLSQAEIEDLYVIGIQTFVAAPNIKSGFLRNAKGALVTAAASTDTWQSGYLRKKTTGALVVTESLTGAKWRAGFLRSATGALIVKEAGAEGPVWKSEFLRDKNGALCVIKSEAETPIAWRSGFLRNKSGRLLIE